MFFHKTIHLAPLAGLIGLRRRNVHVYCYILRLAIIILILAYFTLIRPKITIFTLQNALNSPWEVGIGMTHAIIALYLHYRQNDQSL